ncbi:MAG: glycosyltransferase family 39 protein [Methanomassiliicoccales archaeon]|nr:MAG: glycosyltransferase family 39 protein [Methanomassiliicoccales archaeon]
MSFGFDVSKEDRRNVLALLMVGLALKLYAFSQMYLISDDGAFQYLPVAKLFYEGKYLQALTQPQLPLYPFLISALTRLMGNPELAGQVISIVFSLFAVVPLYFLGRTLFGAKSAFWTGLLYLVNPVMLKTSVDVLKEGLVVFFVLSAVYCSVRFLVEGGGLWFIWAVILSILGALTRITALSVLFALCVWLGYQYVRGGPSDGKRAYPYHWAALFMAAVGLALIFPGLMGWDVMVTKKYYGVAREVISKWPSVLHLEQKLVYAAAQFVTVACLVPFVVALVAMGSRIRAREFNAEEWYLVLLIILTVPSFLIRDSSRYLLPAVFLLYVWAGHGLVKAKEYIDKRYPGHSKLAAVVVVTVVLASILPMSLRPQRLGKVGRREVGLWLKQQPVAAPVIVTNVPRVAYYAGGHHILVDAEVMSMDEIIQLARGNRADYLALEVDAEASAGERTSTPFEGQNSVRLVLTHPYGRHGTTIYVYKLR